MNYRRFVKRPCDFLCSLILLLLLFPVYLILIFALALVQRNKVFFVQERPGKHHRIFKIIKFKTMNDKRDRHGRLLPDAERLTAIGKIVRKTSLDEIPQLINVLKGEMSIVGPRPLLPEYLELYNERQKKRHLVKPGITGWAQINGRNEISWEKKLEMDVWYVENQSFILDLKILWRTFMKVLKSEGINAQGSASAEKYKG